MRRLIRTLCLMGAVFGLVATTGAAEVTAADARNVRAVIQAQLAAFAADDAQRAFSYAAPKLRDMFGNADNFVAMVRAGYPVVYRPASVAFLKPEHVEGGLAQGVHMTDANGVLWLALYRLERQPDKSWRISACQIVEAAGVVT